VPRWLRWRDRPRGSIRLRITALAAVLVAMVLIVAAVALVAVQRQQLVAGVDATLEQRADDLAGLVRAGDRPPVRLSGGQLDGFAQLVTDRGEVLAASPNLAGAPAIPAELDPGRTQTVRTVAGLPVDNDAFRLLTRRVETPTGPALLHLGASLDDISDGTAALATSLAVTIPLVVALLTLLVWWLAGRILAPVEGIRSEVAEIGATDLHRRVAEPAGADEISRLARTMNGMLDRLEDALRRQQRFVADASHELRSPLTRIRTELEVDLVHSVHSDPADLRATHHSVLAEVVGLQRLVDDLLQLARADAGAGAGRTRPVDLDDLLLREARRVRAAGRVTLDSTGVSGAQVVGDPDQLARAIRNLVDNAERHAATRVVLTLAEVDGAARLTVGNDGLVIPAGQREQIFERFRRLDDARASNPDGAGLGLAIAREIVQRHGGSIAVDPDHRTGARFVVRLPAAPD
jgi:signal transduction histidine kinase